ncbi:hypothetical protein NQ317_000363, partial [Molorchus minor]
HHSKSEELLKLKSVSSAEPNKLQLVTPRRFISSIFGGDAPGNVAIFRNDRVTLPDTEKPSNEKPKPQIRAPVRHFSVIQHTPKTTKRDEDTNTRLLTSLIIQEPEQEQPIDYHIPKRGGELENEEEERKILEQRRSRCSKVTKPIISVRSLTDKIPMLMSAAAGHGRGSSGGQHNTNQANITSARGGSSINFGTASTGGGGGGAIGSGSGGGGMNPGRDGRQNYGPSGNNGSFNTGSNFSSNYMLTNQNTMDCEAGQELPHLNISGGQHSPKQYSTLQNASYGLVMKDEGDLELYEPKN